MNHIKNSVFVVFLFCIISSVSAQDLELLMASEAEKSKSTEYAFATFKGTKVLNVQSIENTAKGVLQVNFQHRFGPINQGVYDFFGLDRASIRFGFDYGINDRLCIGIGRSTMEKAYDGYFKYKILRQSSGAKEMPISLSFLGATAINSVYSSELMRGTTGEYKFAYRMYYTTQLIIARKFSSAFSLQLMPTLIHRNFTNTSADKNTIFALGAAARLKLTKRFGIVAETFYTFPNQLSTTYTPFMASIGLEIETGGHVYHLLFTNANGMIEHQFIGMNQDSFSSGISSMRFGFNLSRVFTIVKPKAE